AGKHAAGRWLGGEQRAGKVCLEDLWPRGQIDLEQRPVGRVGGGVDDGDVDSFPGPVELFEKGRYRGRVALVAGERSDLGAAGTQFLGGHIERVKLATGENHGGAACSQPLRNRQTNAAASARDKSRTPGQVERIAHARLL